MLELQSVGKRYATLNLAEISFTVGDGEYWVLLGPSGVGKTVLLEMIAGLIAPECGRIYWDGRDITAMPPESRDFAVVYQDYALFPHMTVARNITYGLRTRGVPRRVCDERIETLVEQLNIRHLCARFPDTLSGGEQQRVALARALAVAPRLLLLDEPLSAIDIRMRRTLQLELKRINRELRLPILHVTHDAEEALRVADRVCIMLDHRIYQIGPPHEVFRAPSHHAVAQFLGLENILPAALVADHLPLPGPQTGSAPAKRTGAHVVIRPEEIHLSPEPVCAGARRTVACHVTHWEYRDHYVALQVARGDLTLTTYLTYAAFHLLRPHIPTTVHVAFGEQAIHYLS